MYRKDIQDHEPWANELHGLQCLSGDEGGIFGYIVLYRIMTE
jgi:hypothetical protein